MLYYKIRHDAIFIKISRKITVFGMSMSYSFAKIIDKEIYYFVDRIIDCVSEM